MMTRIVGFLFKQKIIYIKICCHCWNIYILLKICFLWKIQPSGDQTNFHWVMFELWAYGHIQNSVHGMWAFKKFKKFIFLNNSWNIYWIVLKICHDLLNGDKMEHQHQKAINFHKGWDRYICNILVQLYLWMTLRWFRTILKHEKVFFDIILNC